MTTNAAIANLIGQPITATTDAGIEVTLTLWHAHAAINVWNGPNRIEEWSGNVPLADAYREATRILTAFNNYGGPGGVETQRNKLAFELDGERDRLARSRDPKARKAYEARVEHLETQIAALDDLQTVRTHTWLAAQRAA